MKLTKLQPNPPVQIEMTQQEALLIKNLIGKLTIPDIAKSLNLTQYCDITCKTNLAIYDLYNVLDNGLKA